MVGEGGRGHLSRSSGVGRAATVSPFQDKKRLQLGPLYPGPDTT